MTKLGVPRFLQAAQETAELDLEPGIGQRVSTFRYELFSRRTGIRLGDVTPLRTTIPVLVHNTANRIVRTLTGLNFGVEDTEQMNPVTDRIVPYMMMSMPDGSVSEFRLGTYMYDSFIRNVTSGGDLSQNSLFDEMFIVDQQLPNAFSVTDLYFGEAVRRLLAPLTDLGLLIYNIQGGSGFNVSGSWPAGTSRAQVLADMCTQSGYFQPWFDNDGIMQIIAAFNPADKLPEFDYDLNEVVYQNTAAYTTDLLYAPNRFIVINNSGTTDIPTYGTYDIPTTAPHSIANRGFVIPQVTDLQSNTVTPSSAQMYAAAKAIAEQSTSYERYTLSTTPDPRHDSYNVIRWQGEQWMEIAWSMQMQEGSPTIRTIRKAYS